MTVIKRFMDRKDSVELGQLVQRGFKRKTMPLHAVGDLAQCRCRR